MTNYQYDELSRLKQVSAAGLSTITYGYDELDPAHATHYEYDLKNNLTRVLDARDFETLSDPDASNLDKVGGVGLTALGLIDPVGGGYATAARGFARKAIPDFVAGAKVVHKGEVVGEGIVDLRSTREGILSGQTSPAMYSGTMKASCHPSHAGTTPSTTCPRQA